jgi:hypothetical protein
MVISAHGWPQPQSRPVLAGYLARGLLYFN